MSMSNIFNCPQANLKQIRQIRQITQITQIIIKKISIQSRQLLLLHQHSKLPDNLPILNRLFSYRNVLLNSL